jgi:hypothetical protein
LYGSVREFVFPDFRWRSPTRVSYFSLGSSYDLRYESIISACIIKLLWMGRSIHSMSVFFAMCKHWPVQGIIAGITKSITIIILDIIRCPVSLFKTQCFGDWILSPSENKRLALSIEFN